ncbi:MAG: hypothetical protein JO022_19055, partial [Acidobacteriaceae bacterium]|nr:hypothetical protein [Acidobacteriaceae bacterium]
PRVAYRVLLHRLAEAGRVRWFGETRESFATRNANLCPVIHDFTTWHVASAFGRTPVVVKREHYLDMHRSAVRQLASGVPWWRRALGILNPLSAWRTG